MNKIFRRIGTREKRIRRKMEQLKRIVGVAGLLLLSLPSARADWYSATVTVTNTGGVVTNGATLTVNSDVRTWTNSVFVPATQILTNGTLSGAVASLLGQVSAHPFSGVQIYPVTDGFTIRSNAFFAVSVSAGWATVSFATNVTGTAVAVRVPYTVESPAQQTNIASGVAAMVASSANTNKIPISKIDGTIGEATHAASADAATMATNANNVTAGILTNLLSAGNVFVRTNTGSQVIDFGWGTAPKPIADFSTNASFAFSGFTHIGLTNYNQCVTIVTNSSGSTIDLTAPDGVHTQGTWNSTNVTAVSWFFDPILNITNGIAFPLW